MGCHTFQMPTNSSRRSFTISARLNRISWFGYTVMMTLQGKRGTVTSAAAPATYGICAFVGTCMHFWTSLVGTNLYLHDMF